MEDRTWANQVASHSAFDNGTYETVLQAVTIALASRDPHPEFNQKHHENCPDFLAMSPTALWSGLHQFLQLLPTTLLDTHKRTMRQLSRAIVGHLHDTGPHFLGVLRAFVYFVEKDVTILWNGENQDYPQVIFDSIKDNPAFIRMVQDLSPFSSQRPWFLEWFQIYVLSLRNSPIFEDILRKLVGFMGEELQHERFGDKRPTIMASVLSVILKLELTVRSSETIVHLAMARVLDMHAHILVDVAFSPNKKSIKWDKARVVARKLVLHVLTTDTKRGETMVFQLSVVLQNYSTSNDFPRNRSLDPPHFHEQVWKKMFGAIDGEEIECIAMLTSLVAKSAHLDTLSSGAFKPNFPPPDKQDLFGPIIESINRHLKLIRIGFLDVIVQCTSSSAITPESLQFFLREPDMVKHIVALLLSPVDELQVASQTLLGHAYDVDVRSECFHALLHHLPVLSLNGLIDFITTFNDSAAVLPEVCSLAKSVVRCLTDVIEVLSNHRDGLFSSKTFRAATESDQQLPNLWRLMCSAITVIFRRTPHWSKYYDPDVMIDWMRDALIFARDLLSQRRTFELVSNSGSHESKMAMGSPRKLSNIGKQMLDDLQPVFKESIRWLRLTDMELLHQSSSLVQSLMECFRETNSAPSADALGKLEKFLDSARRQTSPNAQTRLSESHLSELTAALSSFSTEDDEVQIIGESKPDSKSVSDHTWIVGNSQAGNRRHIPVEQQKLDDYFPIRQKEAAKPGSSIRTSRPSTHVQKGIKHVKLPSSLMALARSATAAQAARTHRSITQVSRIEHSSGKLSAKPSEIKRPLVKDETRLTKVVVPEATSSSGEDSDEGNDVGGLESLGKLQKSPRVKKPAERRTVQLVTPKLTEQNPALERIRKREEAQRLALRMKPDLRPLHRIILSWDYDHDGQEPPNKGDQLIYTQIANSFENDKEYQKTFEPLLVLECWNQLMKSKEEVLQQALLSRIDSRQFVDDWLEVDVSVIDRPPEKWRLAETDIVLLRQSGGKKSVLAKVNSFRMRPKEIDATLRCLINDSSVDPGLHIGTQWRLTRVFSLSTIAREFAALKALPYYDFHADIMRPRLAGMPHVSPSQVQQAMKCHHVNEPQATAILSSLQVEGFSLIQGPPGTGKTWTICGLVGAFISTRSQPATIIHAGRNAGPTEKMPPKKVLVCAPSNAAIDEVAKRLKAGVRKSDGSLAFPNIVRVGADDVINIAVQDISLEQLVDQRLNADSKQNYVSSTSATGTLASLRAEMDSLRDSRASKVDELSKTLDNVARTQVLEEELKAVNNKRMLLSQQYNRLKDQQQSDFRALDAARRKQRSEVLFNADVICSTLSGAGHEVLQGLEFEMIIIDEAAQSIELSSLIPLKYQSKRCIMVGDPQQLPPTVLSPLANKYGYGQSLFVRLQKSRPGAVHLLSIQYRMHPDISRLPSMLFYDKRLGDGPGMGEKNAQPWHNHALFGTYKFLNVSSGGEQQAQSGHSLFNRVECDVAVALYTRIVNDFPKIDFDFRIGIIAMYRAQLLELKKRFQTAFGKEILSKIDFNTVDGFQGQEKDIIILSCVRAGPGVQTIGFLTDQRRLNVAITRSKCSLFILGHAATLERSDEVWKEILRDARANSRLLEADMSTFRRSISTTLSKRPEVDGEASPKSLPSTQAPNYLKTPKSIIRGKFPIVPPMVGSSHNSAAYPKDVEKETNTKGEPGDSNVPRKRRNSSVGHEKRPAADTRDQTSVPRPPPIIKRRPKEVSMFIPKKPGLKRQVLPHPEQRGAKRRLTDQHFT